MRMRESGAHKAEYPLRLSIDHASEGDADRRVSGRESPGLPAALGRLPELQGKNSAAVNPGDFQSSGLGRIVGLYAKRSGVPSLRNRQRPGRPHADNLRFDAAQWRQTHVHRALENPSGRQWVK